MSKYPYILSTGRLRSFIEIIPKMGIPPKINTRTLPTLGFKSTNDRPIVKILEFINFIDASGAPTQNYRDFRDSSKAKIVMASEIRKAYSELFGIYHDAFRKDDNSLKNFFRPTTDAGEQVVERIVDTFKVLCSFADFEAVPPEEVVAKERAELRAIPSLPSGVTLNVNIQLALPATDDASVYDKIFKALKDHLLARD